MRRVVYFNVVLLLCGIVLIELGFQVYAFFHPSYTVLFLEPDQAVGWKQAPNLHWTWAGAHWWAQDFSVPIITNSYGFRDSERRVEKEASLSRIAVLGDSFVEAVQVPLSQTATKILEQQLNTAPTKLQKYEVLNFGISSYSVGQYLLVWREYVSHFKPDYVFIFVAGLQMNRTARKMEASAFHSEALEVRPSFTLVEGKLLEQPASDHQAFVKTQNDVIAQQFRGKRIKKRHGMMLLDVWSRLRPVIFTRVKKVLGIREGGGWLQEAALSHEEILSLNLKVIEKMSREIRDAGAQLIIVDATRYFDDPLDTTERLKDFCIQNDLGYVALSEPLLEANRGGTPTHWQNDGHFNVAGNKIFADAMEEWLRKSF